MKKFVLKVVGFGTIVILVFGSWSGMLFYLEVTSYARESKMPGGTVVAVCGDSQTELGLQPRIWPHFFNFSQSAIQLDQIELKTLDLLDRNPEMLQTLLIDISPRKLAVQSIDQPLIEARNASKRFLLHLLHPKESRRSLDGIVVLFRDIILVQRTKKAWSRLLKGKPYKSSLGCPGAADVRTEEQVAENRRDLLARPPVRGFRDHLDKVRASMDEHAAEMVEWGPASVTSKTSRCIHDIVALVKSRGVRPVLITPPWHGELRARVPKALLDNFRATMREIARDNDVVWLDYLETSFADDEWRDGNHLNAHGAVRFTERVRRDVENLRF